jgi:hypothetical protein
VVIVEIFAGNVQNFVENFPKIVENPSPIVENFVENFSATCCLAMVSTICTGFQQSFQHLIVETIAMCVEARESIKTHKRTVSERRTTFMRSNSTKSDSNTSKIEQDFNNFNTYITTNI